MIRCLFLVISLVSGLAVAAPVSRDDPEHAGEVHAAGSAAVGAAVVVTAHPKASAAALAVLQEGGQAIDALVAAQSVLAVVEPQSSGLGGGGFLLHWDARQQELEVFDGRETAPASSRPDDLLTPEGQPLPWRTASSRLTSIGVPGTVALLWEAHQRHGLLTWPRTLQPAIRLAQDGFLPSPRLRRSIELAQRLGVGHSPAFQALYLPDGQPPALDQRFRNPALAQTFEELAQVGAPGFYRGSLAQQMVKTINTLAPSQTGFRGWSISDLASYAVRRRRPLCRNLQRYRLCTIPPPSSGGLGLLQTLALLNTTGELPGPTHPEAWYRLARAIPLADADRLYWLRDPIDGPSPTESLLRPSYLRRRALLMESSPGFPVQPGLPPEIGHFPFALPGSGHEQGTTHVSIVDRQGNVASYSGSVETVFGSRYVVQGMVMNNQLTDFSFRPDVAGVPVANRRMPGRRPLSSMAPVIVFEEGAPVMVLGSPGGRTIPHFLSRVLVASLIWKEPPSRAVALPHLSIRRGSLVLEKDPPLAWPFPLTELNDSHQPLRQQRFSSGTALLHRINGVWHGAADPRREGTALGLP